MTMDWASKAASASAGISRVGVDAFILRPSGADLSTYPPIPGVETSFACKVVLGGFSARDRNGTPTTDLDLQAIVAPDASTDPRTGDRLSIQGTTYEVIGVETIQPGGTPLLYVCQIRASRG